MMRPCAGSASDGEDPPRRLCLSDLGGRPSVPARARPPRRETPRRRVNGEVGPRPRTGHGRRCPGPGPEAPRGARRGGPAVRIRSVRSDPRRRAFAVSVGRAVHEFPWTQLDVVPSATDPVVDAAPDPELGNGAFTYRLASGARARSTSTTSCASSATRTTSGRNFSTRSPTRRSTRSPRRAARSGVWRVSSGRRSRSSRDCSTPRTARSPWIR